VTQTTGLLNISSAAAAAAAAVMMMNYQDPEL